jgi:nucleoside-diphosphate-sugar epimerase
MSQLHVVFGAGQIGRPLAHRLLQAGHEVRVVTRSGSTVPGAEAFAADLSDVDQAVAAAAGATVVYQAINAPYTRWATLLEPLQRGALEGARAAGARLVILDNLYAYGVPDGPIRADSPLQPCSRKGRIRQRLHELLTEARDGGMSIAIGRAADFFGPEVTEAIFSATTLRSHARGGRAPVPGDPRLPRAYSFAPDVVEGLLALGADPTAEGVWMLPTLNTTTSELLAAVAEAGGVAGRTIPLPRWVLRAGGVVVPLLRELDEMAYQWEVPYTVDCEPFAERFGIRPTPLTAAAATFVEPAAVA